MSVAHKAMVWSLLLVFPIREDLVLCPRLNLRSEFIRFVTGEPPANVPHRNGVRIVQVSVLEDGKFEESLIGSISEVDDGYSPSICKVVLHVLWPSAELHDDDREKAEHHHCHADHEGLRFLLVIHLWSIRPFAFAASR